MTYDLPHTTCLSRLKKYMTYDCDIDMYMYERLVTESWSHHMTTVPLYAL